MGRKGVSPVIATILMVAITVVLAAVLYVMVSGYMQGGGMIPISGALTCNLQQTSPNNGNATFELALSNPANPALSDVSVKFLDQNGTMVAWNNGTTNGSTGNFWLNWTHIVSDQTHIKGGDRLIVTAKVATQILSYDILVTVSPYSGVVEGHVPP